MKPSRSDLFCYSLSNLDIRQQYFALCDLCKKERESKNLYPSEQERDQLLEELHSWISPDPIGLKYSSLSQVEFREGWASCARKLSVDKAAAITAARSLLESIIKTIIEERGQVVESQGNLLRMFKQASKLVEFGEENEQSIREVTSGFSSIINGISSISNSAGDRHGMVRARRIDDSKLAELCINAAGTVGLALIDFHLLTPLVNEGQKTIQ